jgi:hypothetical protein
MLPKLYKIRKNFDETLYTRTLNMFTPLVAPSHWVIGARLILKGRNIHENPEP